MSQVTKNRNCYGFMSLVTKNRIRIHVKLLKIEIGTDS